MTLALSQPPSALLAPQPDSDDLAANDTGWLLGRGHPGWRLFPSLTRYGPRLGHAAGFLPTILWSGHWLAGLTSHPLAPLILAVSLATALRVAAPRLTRALAEAWVLRPFAKTRAPHPAAAAPGTRVRLAGTICAQATVPSLFRGQPCVLSRNQLAKADETRGIDFWMETNTGERILIHVRNAIFDDRPTPVPTEPSCGPVWCDSGDRGRPRIRLEPAGVVEFMNHVLPPRPCETALRPGDKIEVCGLLHREAGPAGHALPGRGSPIYWSLRSGGKGWLVIRRASAALDAANAPESLSLPDEDAGGLSPLGG